MLTERHVHLFRNGRNQAVRIPRDFEIDGSDASFVKKEFIKTEGKESHLAAFKD